MTTHSPAPWHSAVEHPICVISDRRHMYVAELGHLGGYASANIRLITAAPDLLAALEKILSGPLVIGVIPSADVAEARAAIKKARGE